MTDYLNHTAYNVSWFKKTNDDGLLDIHPPFQRNPVWTEKQQSYLVDSILRGYPIPEIYLQEKVSADGESRFTIVDGQQRIRTVLAFIAGELQLDAAETTAWANMTFSDLSEADKKMFFAYKFIIRLLPEIAEIEMREIFQRINKNNVSLNAQELRQSTYSGEFICLINEISDKEYWKELGIFSPKKIRRMLDSEYVSEIAIAYLNGPQNKKDKLDYYYTMYETDFDSSDKLSHLFDSICSEIVQLLPNIRRTRWSNMVDFYTLFLVLSQFKDELPFSSDLRDKLTAMLTDFSEKVNTIQAGNTDAAVNPNHTAYAAGVRNSSDLGSRRQRYTALEREILLIINS